MIFSDKDYKNMYLPFVWHGFFLALTMAMIELNTVLPSLISELTKNTVIFGGIYSIMLGAPLIFNLIFSSFQQRFEYKKKFLLIGIYARSLSFLGMAIFTYFFAKDFPVLTLISFYILIFLFSISGGFAGIAYSDIIGRLLPSEKRGGLYAARQFFGGIASVIGGILIVWIFKKGNFQFPANYSLGLLIGSIGLITGAIGFWMIKEPRLEKVFEKKAVKKIGILKNVFNTLKKDKTFLRYIIVENMSSFSLMILPFYIVFVKNQFTDYKNYLGFFVIAQVSGSILSNFLWAFISKKLGSKITVKICILTGGLIPVLVMLITPLGIVWFLIIFLLIGVISSGRNIGFEPYLLDIAPDDKRTMYLGIRGSLNIFVVLLPLAGGFFISMFGYYITFIIVSVVMFAAFFLVRNENIKK
jgi:MFS family permease